MVGKKVLFLCTKNIIDLGDMLGGGDQDQVGVDLFAESQQFFLKIGHTVLSTGMNFIFYVILDQEANGKIKVGVDLLLKVFIQRWDLVKVDF